LTVTDDGRGLNRERIVKKAVERGLVTPTRAEAMTDAEVHRFVFEPGFSTAENVTELSGRGVGLDVVRNNIEQISSTPGHGATVSLLIPLTLAILPAMMVGIGVGPREEIFAFPIANIVEIVRPGPLQISTIGSRPVLRLRDGVIPLVLGASVFGIRAGSSENGSSPFVLVLSVGDDRLALSVSRLLGQQDIVVKPLDGVLDSQSRPISGATIREDGGVPHLTFFNSYATHRP
jgi:two-component system chemotaxis sensor kinase CheA